MCFSTKTIQNSIRTLNLQWQNSWACWSVPHLNPWEYQIPMIVWLVDHVINEYKYVSRSELVLSLLWSGGYAPWCVHKGANPISSSCFVVSSTVSDSIKLSIFTSFSKLFIQGELLSPSLPHLKNKIKLLCSTRKLIHKMG